MMVSGLFPALMAASLLVAGLLSPATAVAASACRQGDDAWVWTTPLSPESGEPLTILAVATGGDLDQVQVTDPAGRRTSPRTSRGGGPPWHLQGTLPAPQPGAYRIEAMRGGRVLACAEVRVGGGAGDRGSGDWDLAAQALYAAWIERLFDAPPNEPLNFPSLAPVLADPGRNFLHGYLGKDEDRRLPAEPDCADLSYFLRAYFAWKLGLPIAYRACSRGGRDSPPRCEAPLIDRAFAGPPAPAGTFRDVSRRLMDRVHSGSGRTALGDEATDFYPVPLDRAALWPGTLYADPYGHTLILVKWIPQTAGHSGLLLAVDAQPDNSVSRKRFWEGAFLFAETPSAGPGFKAHRPLVARGTGLRLPTNGDLDGRDGTPPYSAEQASLSSADFYARMEHLINPRGLDPEAAYDATLAALMEQIETRVTSVDNGETYMRAHPGTPISMPSGPAIFETTGPWEDYATPSRDMRLLIALKVLEGLPERIRRYPQLYVLRGESPATAAARIERLHARRIQERFVGYTRSDGSTWRLSLADLYARRPGLEVGYNP
ncbi:MAG: hypothetical protein IT487_12730, partial [Chromatiaceae bacterium]|nr:hypothetical protein [Chromatiaceae bacterium]